MKPNEIPSAIEKEKRRVGRPRFKWTNEVLAEAWKKVAEHLRKRFNYFGGKILSRKDWGLPQIHDTLLVRSVSKEDWVDYVLPKLDLDKMVNERSGLPFTDKTIREALSEVYDNISTEGMATFKPGT